MTHHNLSKELNMNSTGTKRLFAVARDLACAFAAASVFSLSANAAAPAKGAPQTSFPSPEEAAKALLAAAKSGDAKSLLAILGPDAKPIIQSGDPVADRAGLERFVKTYEEANKLEKSGDSKTVLAIGKDGWPFPIPLVKGAAGWRFDTKAGKEEILNRRIGRNEFTTTQAALAYVDAQREYYRANPQRDKLFQYAQRFVSTKGKRDGLYYSTKAGEPPSPLGPLYASARYAGYGKGESKMDDAGKPASYHGYHYRILKGQGPDAPGGAYDYVVQGRMIGGHALIAWPAAYGNSGVMTFIVNHDGALYEKDLGPDTAAAAQKVMKFNPDKTWKRVKEGV